MIFFAFLQLVSNALQFLATVADRAQYRNLFEDPTTLSNICEKVIIPNMEFRGNYYKWYIYRSCFMSVNLYVNKINIL